MSQGMIGRLIQKRYQVEAFVASGGMKTVYKVRDLERSVPLAMKMLHGDLEEDPAVLRSFQRESNAIKKLSHPNIVRFYGMEKAGDTYFMLEEFIDGPSLKDILKERRVLPVEEALVYFRALCAALGFAHANGVVHCDVKPGNVMVNQGGNILLTDFGIARHGGSDSTSTFAGAGTPAYMAPEQVRGDAVTAETDIYALGIVLFEMLTGQRPFRGNEAGLETAGNTQNERIRYAQLKLSPPNPYSLNPLIPEKVANAILTAMAKRPGDRFSEMRLFLKAVCEGAGVAEGDISPRVALLQPGMGETSGHEPERAMPLAQSSRQVRARLWPQKVYYFVLAGVVLLTLGFFMFRPPSVIPTPLPTQTIAPSAETVRTLTSTLELIIPTASATVGKTITNTISPMPTETEAQLPSPILSPTVNISSGNPLQLSGSGTVRLTFDQQDYYMPVLSQDQRRMASFVCNSDGSVCNLVEVDPNGGGFLRQITTGSNKYYHPRFSANGKTLLAATDIGGSFDICIIDFETGQILQTLTDDKGPDLTPYWFPGESRFAFMSKRDGDYEVYIGYMDGSEPKQLTHNSSYDGTTVVSPDGRWIAFYSTRSGNGDIFVYDVETGKETQLTSDDAREGEPTFSPDGQWIAFEKDNSGNYSIWAIHPDGSDLHKVVDTEYRDQIPIFSPDGQWILYSSKIDGYYQLTRTEWVD